MGIATMYLIRSILVSADTFPTEQDAHAASDALWALSLPSDGLEHLRTRNGCGYIDLMLFLRGADHADALCRAYVLCRRLVIRSPKFRGWCVTKPDSGLESSHAGSLVVERKGRS